MPTPVSAARQCLTDEAARALDDAVSVARRRGHAQTTSLHAVSALLALPSSALRDACARARSSAYSPRLQFRALELSVGVSLDRLPSSKTAGADDGQSEPPVSNSLMAAIKRSQANQRRHPDSFHFHHQIHAQAMAAGNPAVGGVQAAPVLRVEMKHFVLSILDDPIVSRVFGEAGFRSCDIKLAVLHPPIRHQLSPYGRARCPPVFLCNLSDSDLSPNRRGFGFSFLFSQNESGDENSRRIGEVLARKSGKNPLLLGACAGEALKSFAEGLQSGKASHFPAEINGITLFSVEKEASEFVVENGNNGKLESRLEEASRAIEQCSGRGGVVLSIGDLKSFVGDGVVADRVSSVVSRLKGLLELHNGKLWLIAAAASYEVYSKFSGPFPGIEKDWDLHILPITSSSKSPAEGLYSKSSLLGSFVPFGGFFAAPSELKSPCSSTTQCFTRCLMCTEKYEQEVASVLKSGSTLSVPNPYSESLPCFQMAEHDTSKGLDVMKTKDCGTTLSDRISGLQKKWNDICQRLHHTQPGHKPDMFLAGSNIPAAESFPGAAYRKESDAEDSPNANKTRSAESLSCTTTNLQKNFPSTQSSLLTMASEAQKSPKGSESYPIEIEGPRFPPRHVQDMNLPPDSAISSAPVVSVTTDLGLGTIYASAGKDQKSVKLQDPKIRQQQFPSAHFTNYGSTNICGSRQVVQSSAGSLPSVQGQFDSIDVKSLKRILVQKVGWQDEAISAISQAVCRSRSGGGGHRGSNLRGDIWLAFLGPDRVGKKRIALALAEMLYGSRENLVSVDLGFQDRGRQTHSIFEEEDGDDYDLKFRGKTVVDYLAGELSRKHHSVVFLENVDKADLLVQSSLSQAIRTGKFPDSRGREISINNALFVITTNIVKGKTSHRRETDPIKFPEEMVLAAKRFQMQILTGSFAGNANNNLDMNVQVMPKEETPSPSAVNKRKLIDTSDSFEEAIESQKRAHKARSFLDLNVPLEEIEEAPDCEEYDSDSISESSEAWLEDFLDQVDEKVAMKPFDFDALAAKIIENITTNVKAVLGPEAILKIDYSAMVQILGAAWLSEEKGSVECWIEQVLCRGLAGAKKYDQIQTSGHVVRLVSSGPLGAKEQTCCVCLPSRITTR